MRTIAFLLLLACAARAGESLVAQLETELRALVKGVDAAADAAVVSAAGAPAILAGTPPRVVAPYSAIGDAARAVVRLADGREVTATRWGGDPELGVVVLKLPDDVAKDLRGVDVEGDWERIGAGSIAVAAGGRGHGGGRLGLVSAAEPRLGVIEAPGDGTALFGSRGTLIGLRGGADLSSCMPCHQTEGGKYWREYEQLSRSSYDLAAALKKKGAAINTQLLTQRAHWGLGPASFWTGTKLAYDSGFRPNREASGQIVAGPVIRRVLDDLEKHGEIRQAYLGVVVGDVEGAVKVTSVVPGSPAEAARLDRMVFDAIDGIACPSAALFGRVLALHRPGDEVTLSRAGQPLFKVTLGERSEAKPGVVTTAMLGMQCVNLGPELRRFLGIEDAVRGVVILEIDGQGPAEGAGLRRGIVITKCNGSDVADLEELEAALASAKDTLDLEGIFMEDGRRTGFRGSLTLPGPEGR